MTTPPPLTSTVRRGYTWQWPIVRRLDDVDGTFDSWPLDHTYTATATPNAGAPIVPDVAVDGVVMVVSLTEAQTAALDVDADYLDVTVVDTFGPIVKPIGPVRTPIE